MKNIILALVALALYGCSNIDEADRFVEMPTQEAKRAILIEDFTGQSCVNCPEATAIIHEMQELYGEESIIAIGVYSGPMGAPQSATATSLVTDLGTTYWDHWFTSETGQPVGVINRIKTASKEEWKNIVSEYINETTPVSLDIETKYDSDSRQLVIQSDIEGPAMPFGKYQLMLVEDSIVGYQKYLDNGRAKTNKEYLHNHVLRASVNGEWGEDLPLDKVPSHLTHTITLDSEWNAEHVQVIGLFYTNKEGIIQVKKKKVTQ